MANRIESNPKNRRGFTLVELMVVVTIIALIASIAIPSFSKSRRDSIASRTANDFRRFADKFQLYNLSTGDWPTDGLPASFPDGMEEILDPGNWASETAIGGLWDWDYNAFGFTAGVSVEAATVDDDTLRAIDTLIDDGLLSSGRLRKLSDSHFSFILEE